MIDLHTHILPNVDDGPDFLEDAIMMARMAHQDGIHTIFCTPHHHWTRVGGREVQRRVDRLQGALDTAGIPVTLLAGHEVHLFEETALDLASGLICTLGHSPFILAEPKFTYYGPDTDALLEDLFDQGLKPIMAHPERIEPLQGNLKRIEWFLECGGLTQITAQSLLRPDGHPARDTSVEMLKADMVHIIASDMHNPTLRPPGLSKAVKAAADIVGKDKAKAMVTTIPKQVVTAARTPETAVLS